MNQTTAILKHLQTHGHITPLQALNKYHSFRLSSVIHRLRKRGYKIKTILVKAPNSEHEFAKYILG